MATNMELVLFGVGGLVILLHVHLVFFLLCFLAGVLLWILNPFAHDAGKKATFVDFVPLSRRSPFLDSIVKKAIPDEDIEEDRLLNDENSSESVLTMSGTIFLEYPKAIQEKIKEITFLFCKNYVDYWYAPISENDPKLSQVVKENLNFVLTECILRFRDIDKVSLFVDDCANILTNHFQNIRRFSNTQFPLHPCLESPTTEIAYLRQLAEVILRLFCKPNEVHSPLIRSVLRETLVFNVLKPSIDNFCDPDYLNQYIIYRCDVVEERFEQSKKNYLYAADYAGFLKFIEKAETLDVLHDVRYHIIVEIMQATRLEELKRRSAQDKQAAALLAETNSHLKNRNLKQYVNQCKYAKVLCERRITMLGGPQYSPGHHGPGHGTTLSTHLIPSLRELAGYMTDRFLTLQEILKDGLALSYFMQYLESVHGKHNLLFYLVCDDLFKDDGEKKDFLSSQISAVVEVFSDQSPDDHINISRDLEGEIRHLGAKVNAQKDAPLSADHVACLRVAQAQVLDFLRQKHYRAFVMSGYYRDFVRHRGTSSQNTVTSDDEEIKERLFLRIRKEIKNIFEQVAKIEASGNKLDKSKKLELEALYLQKREFERTQRWFYDSLVCTVEIISIEGLKAKEGPLVHLRVIQTDNANSNMEQWQISKTGEDFIALLSSLKPFLKRSQHVVAMNRSWWARTPEEKIRENIISVLNEMLKENTLLVRDTLYRFLSTLILGGGAPAHAPRIDDDSEEDSLFLGSDLEREEASYETEGDGSKESRDSIAQPLYRLVTEVFELRGLLKWLRRQLILFVQITYGRTIDQNLRDTVEWLFSDAQVLFYLENFRATMFPDEWTPPPPRTSGQKEATMLEAKEKWLRNIPSILFSLVGQKAAMKGYSKMFDAVQNTLANKHVAYTLLEQIILQMSPEIQAIRASNIINNNTATGNNIPSSSSKPSK